MSIFGSHFEEVGHAVLQEQLGDDVLQYPGGDATLKQPVAALVSIGETELQESSKGGKKRYVTRGILQVDAKLSVKLSDRWKIGPAGGTGANSEEWETERIGKVDPGTGKRFVYLINYDREHTRAGEAS